MIKELPRINRDSYEPGYAQLVRIIQKEIENGRLRSGDKLPSESQLCKLNGISPMTVRRAINILVEKGLVITEQGRGTFVKPLQFWSSAFNLSNLQQVLSDEKETKIKILEARISYADDRIASRLNIKTGTRVIFTRRLIMVHDQPIIYHKEYLIYDPTRQIIESEMEVTSLKGIFEGSGNSTIKGGTLTLLPTALQEDEAQLLQAKVSSPAFCLENIFYDFNNVPVSCGWFICPGDRLKFTTVVGT